MFFDFGPIQIEPIPRDYPIAAALAQQELLLLGLIKENRAVAEDQLRLDAMKEGLERLRALLNANNTEEAAYQEVLRDHPWMLGGVYEEVLRHANLDDARIPDFTARRAYDRAHDIIEIKQPFLTLYRQAGDFAAAFHDAWNQCERYVAFCQRQRSYLLEEKGLLFENPRCYLVIGYCLTPDQRRLIREKESLLPVITVWTYEEVVAMAAHLIGLMESAAGRVVDTR